MTVADATTLPGKTIGKLMTAGATAMVVATVETRAGIAMTEETTGTEGTVKTTETEEIAETDGTIETVMMDETTGTIGLDRTVETEEIAEIEGTAETGETVGTEETVGIDAIQIVVHLDPMGIGRVVRKDPIATMQLKWTLRLNSLRLPSQNICETQIRKTELRRWHWTNRRRKCRGPQLCK